MITIHLHNLMFYSFHGIYEEEKILGNQYQVNADVQFHEEVSEITSINQTINYVDIYQIIKSRMDIPCSLLETLVMNIGNSIYEKYSGIRSINIQIKKLHPPVSGLQGSVGVSWHKEF